MRLHAFGLGEHTLDRDRLNPTKWVLDVGARGFEFAREVVADGPRVLCLDPSEDVNDPGAPGIVLSRSALGPTPNDLSAAVSQMTFCDCPDGSSSHLVLERPASNGRLYSVPVHHVVGLLRYLQHDSFTAVKLDCEGAEYSILRTWPGPVAQQITVAFHDFITPGEDRSAPCVEHLRRWYDVVQHEATVRHGHETPCHWDSLFVLR